MQSKPPKSAGAYLFPGFGIAFGTRSRRDRLLARWVCDRTGVAELEAYVGEMIDIRMAGADVDGMIAKILADVRSPARICMRC